jgi:hypothetical protein
MKKGSLVFFVFCALFLKAQSVDTLILNSTSILKNLKQSDSITYYQCHVEEAIQQLSTASGQTLTGNSQRYSITEKFVIKRLGEKYIASYYSSSLTILPNRKFSGLKIREKPYWNFKKEKDILLNANNIKVLLALERKGKDAIEYDYAITKYNTNQLIIKLKKDFKQLVIEGDYVLSKLLN